MTSDSRSIDPDWIEALQQSLAAFGTLVIDDRVSQAWANHSRLAGYTIGGIAGHVLSLMMGFQRRIEAPEVDVEIIPYLQWYGPAVSSNERHARLIEAGQVLASRGPDRLAADLELVAEQLGHTLRDATSDLAVPLASIPGKGVCLVDYLRTRFVEITVHGDDIAVSIELVVPAFPPMAWALAAGVISETTSTEGEGAEMVLAATRPGRR